MNTSVARFSRDEHHAEAGQEFIAGGRQYQLMGKVSDGAIGVVRKARDKASGEVVVVKFLAPEFRYIEASSFTDIRERFRREGQKGTALEHPNLVKILAYEDNANATCFEESYPWNPFIIMEYVTGKTLESFIRNSIKQRGSGVFNVNPKTLRIGIALCESLVYLHRRSLVHRDVKPANAFLSTEMHRSEDGPVKLGDFGVVKWNDFLASVTTGQLTTTGHAGLGTLKYMSPEQVSHPREVEISSDIYSLGATLFELFTNQYFDNNLQFFLITMSRNQRGSTLSRLYDAGMGIVPSELIGVFDLVLDMLAFGPTSRPTSTKARATLKFMLERMTMPQEDFE